MLTATWLVSPSGNALIDTVRVSVSNTQVVFADDSKFEVCSYPADSSVELSLSTNAALASPVIVDRHATVFGLHGEPALVVEVELDVAIGL